MLWSDAFDALGLATAAIAPIHGRTDAPPSPEPD